MCVYVSLSGCLLRFQVFCLIRGSVSMPHFCNFWSWSKIPKNLTFQVIFETPKLLRSPVSALELLVFFSPDGGMFSLLFFFWQLKFYSNKFEQILGILRVQGLYAVRTGFCNAMLLNFGRDLFCFLMICQLWSTLPSSVSD